MFAWKQQLEAAGFFQYGIVNTADIHFSQQVRAMCEANTCQKYATTWACPPAVGTVEDCKSRIQQYEKMLVLSGKYMLEDSFDFEGMMASAKAFRSSCRALDAVVRPHIKDYLMFSNEGCDLCEGNGIFVNELANLAGIHYHNGSNTVTYFGAVVCHAPDLKQLL